MTLRKNQQQEHLNIEASELLAQLFEVVLEEAKKNSAFAQRLIAALPKQVVVHVAKQPKDGSSNSKSKAQSLTSLMNRKGEAALREYLKTRGHDALRRIVERQQIPVASSAFDSDLASLREAIVEGVKYRIADRIAAAS